VTTEEMIERGEGKVTQMFMVDGIELRLIYHIFDVRHFYHRDAFPLQQ
jgi:hypothetical protein